MDVAAALLKESMDSSKNEVDLPGSAPPISPGFDDTSVVPIDNDIPWASASLEKGIDEELEADCLCPRNVSSIGLPTWG